MLGGGNREAFASLGGGTREAFASVKRVLQIFNNEAEVVYVPRD